MYRYEYDLFACCMIINEVLLKCGFIYTSFKFVLSPGKNIKTR